MGQNFFMQYQKIVGEIILPPYQTPEEQGNCIKKCTILEPIEEIEYSSLSKDVSKN